MHPTLQDVLQYSPNDAMVSPQPDTSFCGILNAEMRTYPYDLFHQNLFCRKGQFLALSNDVKVY